MDYDFSNARQQMLRQQLRPVGVLDPHILAIMGALPREIFIAEPWQLVAYSDTYLPLGHEQIMLTPKEQALIVQALTLTPQDIVLEVGTGTGYLTSVLAQLAKFVYSIEIFPDFTELAERNLQQLTIDNVQLITDDASTHWAASAPYDAICITAALPYYPENFKAGLKVGGRLFAIVGQAPAMQAYLITRTGETTWQEKVIFETCIPLLITAEQNETFKF